MNFLNENQRHILETQLKTTKDLSHWKRVFAILAYDEARLIEDIAETLRLSPYTVESYINEYRSKNKTKNDPRGGGTSKFKDHQSQELKIHLEKNTYLKVKNIISYVVKKYGVKFSRSGMTRWLIQYGFKFKRPQKIPGKSNPIAQKEFVDKYKEIKECLKSDEEIYFIDAVHPEHQSQAVCGWIQKGEQKTLQTSGKQLRLHFAGALCLDGMKILTEEYKTIDADAMIDFFKKLEHFSKAKVIHVIMDNARANKNKKLDEYLKNSRIRPHYLPPYSPNLNPIERLWKILRETKLYNRYYETFKGFSDQIYDFFSVQIPKMKNVLISRITDNFQCIKINPINVV